MKRIGRPPESIVDKLDKKVITGPGCWGWSAYADKDGYGIIADRKAHRVVYELLVGPIPDGLVLDHLCRNPSCTNPAHLEPVTNKENLARGAGITAQNSQKTECKFGHPFDEANTRVLPKGRACKACELRRSREYEAARPWRNTRKKKR